MKKFFSFFAALLFAGSMMAEPITINATDVTTIEAGATTGLDVTLQGVHIEWEGAYYNNEYSQDFRIYAEKAMKLTATENISKVEIVGYAKKDLAPVVSAGTITAGASFSAETTKATWEDPLLVIEEIKAQSLTITCNKQMRAYSIRITFEGDDVSPTPSINYYVAGNMNEWKVNDAYRLTRSNNGEYKGEFTFVADAEFKVIGFDGENTTWYPEGMDNNFKITEAGDYMITFNPAGNVEGWHEGFFNVVKKEEPVVAQYEVAEAIAAGLKENDELFVRGIITKLEFKGTNFAKYGSVNIYVKDATDAEGEFEFFNCYSLNADTFRTSVPNYDPQNSKWAQFREVADENGNTIHVGDTVVAFGKYKLFNSTHELNTGCYLTEIKHAPVVPADTIEVKMTEGLTFSDNVATEGWWEMYGENDKFIIELSNNKTTQLEGTYTYEDLDPDFAFIGVINGTDTTEVYFVDGAVTLSKDAEQGTITIKGALIGEDGNVYNIELVFTEPKPTETVTVNIQNAVMETSYADYGLYGMYGDDENNVFVMLSVWAMEGLEGQYTEQDLDHAYLGSGIIDGEEMANIYKAAITITPGNGDDYLLTATLLCYNNKQYNVTMYIPAGQGIEDVEATVKAFKRIVNGQVIIEKNGVRYNVLGNTVK